MSAEMTDCPLGIPHTVQRVRVGADGKTAEWLGAEVVHEALKASYCAVHMLLDGEEPGTTEMRDLYDLLAHALRDVGSSGAEALGV